MTGNGLLAARWTSGTTGPEHGSRLFEQMPALGYDVGPCPHCGGTAALVIRGFPRIDQRATSFAVGCLACDHWIEVPSELGAIARWNLAGIAASKKRGGAPPDPELYEILPRCSGRAGGCERDTEPAANLIRSPSSIRPGFATSWSETPDASG